MEKVLVLMSTYNGEKYLVEQIESLLKQEYVEVSLLVRDDGSNDNTITILEKYKKNGLLDYYVGENIKSARSFLDLIMKAPYCKYYAFCDQDDIWSSNKLISGIKKLNNIDLKKPCLYYCGMNIVDENLNKYDYYYRDEDKGNSLLYSFLLGDDISGCTMIFNNKLRDLLCLYNPKYITMHDTWAHRVCLSCNGEIVSSSEGNILYRQHTNNVIGMKKRTIWKLFLNLKNNKGKTKKISLELIKGYSSYINKDTLDILNIMVSNNLIKQLSLLKIAKKQKIFSKRDLFKIFFKILFKRL